MGNWTDDVMFCVQRSRGGYDADERTRRMRRAGNVHGGGGGGRGFEPGSGRRSSSSSSAGGGHYHYQSRGTGAEGAIPAGVGIIRIPAGEAAAALARGQAEGADGGTGSAHPTASEHKTDRIRPPFLSRSQDLSAIHSFTQSRRRE